MFTKILTLATVVAAVCAQYPGHEQSHHQSHAYSSQSIVHHQVQHPQQKSHQQHHHEPAHHVEYHHQAPVLLHQAPVLLHHAPAPSHYQAASHFAPAPSHDAPAHHEEHYAPAKYEFTYHVEDKHTGDIKSQQESRDGDVVKGEYSLHQPDGRIRTVKYTADKHSGFNADVQYSGHAIEPQQQHHH